MAGWSILSVENRLFKHEATLSLDPWYRDAQHAYLIRQMFAFSTSAMCDKMCQQSGLDGRHAAPKQSCGTPALHCFRDAVRCCIRVFSTSQGLSCKGSVKALVEFLVWPNIRFTPDASAEYVLSHPMFACWYVSFHKSL